MTVSDHRISATAILLGIAMALTFATDATAEEETGIRTQGRWSYTARHGRDCVEHIATTPSTQDSETWLIIACRTDEQLNVTLTRTTRFEFPLDTSLRVKLRSTSLPGVSIVGRSILENQIVLDPRVIRHVAPLLIEEDRFTILIPDTNGTTHEYTFLMQPNDIALAPFRSWCLDIEKET